MKNSEPQNIIEVAERTGEFLNKYEPQLEGDTINYYIVGSLAQMLYASASKIEYCNIENGRITDLDTEIEVSEETREKLLLTGRKIGDLDIIGIYGYRFGKNSVDMARNRMEIDEFDILSKYNDKDIVNLMGSDALSGDLDNTVTNDRVCRLTSINGNTVYVASPETIIAQKLDKALKYYGTEFEEEKDIKDLVTFVNGIYSCYSEDELAKRVADAWTEKNGAIPANEKTTPEMKRIFMLMRKNMEKIVNIRENNISLDKISRILAKTIVNYTEQRNIVDINNPISSDIKKNVKNIAKTDMSRNVQSTSTEIKEIYKELENPTHALEDNKSKDE